jgi:hypothetical protein
MLSNLPAIVLLVLHPLTNHLIFVRIVSQTVILQLGQRPGGQSSQSRALLKSLQGVCQHCARRAVVEVAKIGVRDVEVESGGAASLPIVLELAIELAAAESNDSVCPTNRPDGQCKLHSPKVRIWDGRRFVIRFIHFEASASKC